MNKDKNHKSPLDNPSLKKSVFQAPADYFDQQEGRLMDRINAEEGELANAEHLKENIFEAPQGYFSQLEEHIKGKLEEETVSLESSPHLRSPIFETPPHYFETLEARITKKLEDKPEVKVIPLYRKNWFRMAVAAILAVGVFLGLEDIKSDDNTKLRTEISDDAILEYLSDDFDYELMALSDDFDGVINDIMLDETFGLGFDTESNLELEYDFEYFEQ